MTAAEKRCPRCGAGILVDITYREGRAPGGDDVREPIQSGETHQVESYSCGHEVVGPRLDVTAVDDALDVERRGSEDTVDPA